MAGRGTPTGVAGVDAPGLLRCGAPAERWDNQLMCLEFEGDLLGGTGVVDTSGHSRPVNASGIGVDMRMGPGGSSQAGAFADSTLWVPGDGAFDLPGAFTLAAWARVDEPRIGVLGTGLIDRPGQYAMYVGATMPSSPLNVVCVVATLNNGLFQVATGQLAPGAWSFLACTWDGASLCAYAGAAPLCLSSPQLVAAGSGDLAVGHGSNGMDRMDPLTGALDRVQILNVGLTTDEVNLLQAAP